MSPKLESFVNKRCLLKPRHLCLGTNWKFNFVHFQETIEKHKSKAVEGNDFIYSFLQEMNENKSTFTGK